jgi:hypothetical protein
MTTERRRAKAASFTVSDVMEKITTSVRTETENKPRFEAFMAVAGAKA